MHSMNYILEVLEDAKEKINDAINGIDSFDDEEEQATSLPLEDLNELIGLGLVPDVIIQLHQNKKLYRFIRYGDNLMAEFMALDEEEAKKGIFKSELESLTSRRDDWHIVKTESKDKGGEA